MFAGFFLHSVTVALIVPKQQPDKPIKEKIARNGLHDTGGPPLTGPPTHPPERSIVTPPVSQQNLIVVSRKASHKAITPSQQFIDGIRVIVAVTPSRHPHVPPGFENVT
jgi:hypothetical protein